MLAHDLAGDGEPTIVLLHAVGSRSDWDPVWDAVAQMGTAIRFDLPGFGESARDRTASTPPEMADRVAEALDELEVERPVLVGLSIGAWVALELAKRGRAGAVVGLGTAGLWRKRSPLLTDARLMGGWWLSLVYRPLIPFLLRHRLIRRFALREVSARPADVPAEHAIEAAVQIVRAKGWPRIFRRTRGLRFTGGTEIDVPLTLAFGERDRIAPARKSRNADELPPGTALETWEGCGHNLVWDAPDRVLAAIAAAVRTVGAPAARR